MKERIDFNFLKELGDTAFLIELLETDMVGKYYRKKWYPECLYLLAMLDFLSRINKVVLCTRYDDLRKLKLKSTLYPGSVLIAAKVTKNEDVKEKAMAQAIPEFIRFNIVETDVRDVV